MIRVSMVEADRFPEPVTPDFDQLFTQVHGRIDAYLKTTFKLSASTSREAAHKPLGSHLYPRFPRALFGIDELAKDFDREALAPNIDLKPVRRAVTELLDPLQ